MIIIDRFEGKIAVLETESGMKDVLSDLLPENAREGDVLTVENGKYCIDDAATAARKAAVREKFKKLRRKADD